MNWWALYWAIVAGGYILPELGLMPPRDTPALMRLLTAGLALLAIRAVAWAISRARTPPLGRQP